MSYHPEKHPLESSPLELIAAQVRANLCERAYINTVLPKNAAGEPALECVVVDKNPDRPQDGSKLLIRMRDDTRFYKESAALELSTKLDANDFPNAYADALQLLGDKQELSFTINERGIKITSQEGIFGESGYVTVDEMVSAVGGYVNVSESQPIITVPSNPAESIANRDVDLHDNLSNLAIGAGLIGTIFILYLGKQLKKALPNLPKSSEMTYSIAKKTNSSITKTQGPKNTLESPDSYFMQPSAHEVADKLVTSYLNMPEDQRSEVTFSEFMQDSLPFIDRAHKSDLEEAFFVDPSHTIEENWQYLRNLEFIAKDPKNGLSYQNFASDFYKGYRALLGVRFHSLWRHNKND